MLKLENGATFVYLICNVKVNICVRCTVISDKNCQSREVKLYRP